MTPVIETDGAWREIRYDRGPASTTHPRANRTTAPSGASSSTAPPAPCRPARVALATPPGARRRSRGATIAAFAMHDHGFHRSGDRLAKRRR